MQIQNPAVVRALAIQAKFKARALPAKPVAEAQAEPMKLTFPIPQTIEILSDYVGRNADVAAEVALAKLEAGEALTHSDNEPLARLGLAEWEAPQVCPTCGDEGDCPDCCPTCPVGASSCHCSQTEAPAPSVAPAISQLEARRADLQTQIEEALDEINAINQQLYLLEMPTETPDEDDSDDDDFARYGACDDYPEGY